MPPPWIVRHRQRRPRRPRLLFSLTICLSYISCSISRARAPAPPPAGPAPPPPGLAMAAACRRSLAVPPRAKSGRRERDPWPKCPCSESRQASDVHSGSGPERRPLWSEALWEQTACPKTNLLHSSPLGWPCSDCETKQVYIITVWFIRV